MNLTPVKVQKIANILTYSSSDVEITMKKTYFYLGICIMALVSWVYWSVNNDFRNAIIFVKTINSMNDILIYPFNTTCQNHPFLVILVTSYVGHVELRSAHRRAMPPDLLKTMNVSRVFLLARIPKKEKYITQRSLEDESDAFGDILQGSFMENYRNLTYKHLMGLKWASTECSHASFILKVDDDTVFNLERTYKLLKNENLDNTMIGYMLNNTKPRRSKQNKWYVTFGEYSRSEYPPYLSGWYYATTPSVAGKISDEAVYHSKFWIDDILVTGILTEALNIKLRQLPENYWLEYYELLECCLNEMVKAHIMCEYVVGPNGNRNNLIYEFNDAVRNCNRNCTIRPTDRPLKKSCVAYRERNIFSEGAAEIRHIRL